MTSLINKLKTALGIKPKADYILDRNNILKGYCQECGKYDRLYKSVEHSWKLKCVKCLEKEMIG